MIVRFCTKTSVGLLLAAAGAVGFGFGFLLLFGLPFYRAAWNADAV